MVSGWFLWDLMVTTDMCSVCQGPSGRMEPFTCGILPYIQADGIRIELSYRTASWFLRIAQRYGENPHTELVQNP